MTEVSKSSWLEAATLLAWLLTVLWCLFVSCCLGGIALILHLGVGIASLLWWLRWGRRTAENWVGEVEGGGPVAVMLASGLALYVELLLTRYQASLLPVFGFFKNVTLLSAFLGLGIGFSRGASRRNFLPLVPAAVLLQVILLYWARFVLPPLRNPILENLTMGLDTAHSLLDVAHTLSFLGIMATLTAVTCLPLGQFAAHLMHGAPGLKAYGWNLCGSLLGVILFTLLSASGTLPVVWWAVAFALMLGFSWSNRRLAMLATLASILVLCIEGVGLEGLVLNRLRLFSPYQVVVVHFETHQQPAGVSLALHHALFQKMVDLRPIMENHTDEFRRATYYYNLAYSYLNPKPDDVLIVGAGSGNDVSAAVRAGAGHIDAVEIDPVVAGLGRRFHPEQPYSSPTVSLHVTDARHYIRRCQKKYDLIIYGLLDSQTSMGSMSNVRLDSFVYTVEAMREARALLKPGGAIVLSFALVDRHQGGKMYKMLTDAFDGKPPRAFGNGYCGYTYICGVDQLLIENDAGPAMTEASLGVEPSIDDWPFVYMARRTFPLSYGLMIFCLLLLTALMVRLFSSGRGVGFDGQFFLLGSGFMLIETKSLTELGLDFGNTWYLIPIVISTILVLGYLANWAVERLPRLSIGFCYLLLLISIGSEAIFWLSARASSLAHPLSAMARLGILMAPLFFSALVFSLTLRQKNDINRALSSNLLGAMAGGFAEYLSMSLGFHSLAWIGLGIYMAAALFYLVSPSKR